MTTSAEEERKKALADLKKRLEEKVSELQNEANLLKEAISIVDNELAKLSFSSGTEILQSKKLEQKEKEAEKIQFSYRGKSYGVAFVSTDELTIELDQSLNLSSSIRPFEAFFINRLLEGMREADTQNASKGAIRPDQILSYEVIQDGPYIRKIIVKNFRERQRIREILNGLGWTIENMLKNIASSS
ncbi:MAG: hypothetical protein QXS21_04980 [Thermoproteota archaeon]|nr:hypothetical protein [Candidatus Brockarchaeota archaeon]MBO3768174.1 hypothetical protein [Candidatus Brockarchaeota archaeon]MBO3801308.1 hypothetical protein [Candidatus Brockarchaeota archaeon]